jgi:hypothetical protein
VLRVIEAEGAEGHEGRCFELKNGLPHECNATRALLYSKKHKALRIGERRAHPLEAYVRQGGVLT